MAQELIGFKIQIDGQERVVKSLGEMKQFLKEANFELLAAQQNFGEYSTEAINAAKKVATLKDSLQEAGETAQLFDPGKKFQAFAGALSAVAGGISAVQGAIGLLGSESENLQKTLVKVQSALALSQGLNAITDSAKDFQRLKAVAVDAFKGIKAAIGSTGIGLLVIAVGTLVAYWDDIKGAVSGVSSEQDELNKKTEDNLKAEKEKLSAIGGQENILKLQGKTEKEILGIKIKQTDQVIAATEESIKQQRVTLKAQIEASKRNKEILEGILKFISVPITAVLKGVDLLGKAIGKDFGLEEKFFGGIATLVFDPEEVEQEGEKTLQELDNQLGDLKNQRAGFQLSIQNIDKQAADKSIQDTKAKNKAIEEANAELAKRTLEISNELFLNEIKNEKEREEVKLGLEYEKAKKEIEASVASETQKNEALLFLKKKLNADLEALEQAEKDKQIIKSQDELTALIDGFTAEEELTLTYLERDKQLKEQYNQADLEATKELQNQKFDAVNAGLTLIESLAGRNEAIGNIFFAIQKGIEIGRIISSTTAAIAKVSADTASIPAILPPGVPNPAFPIAVATGTKKIIGLKIGAAAGIANIIASSVGKFKSGGSVGGRLEGSQTGGAAPIAPTPSPQVQSTLLNTQAIQQMGNATNRAYVIESDVTNSQERIRRINRAARLG